MVGTAVGDVVGIPVDGMHTTSPTCATLHVAGHASAIIAAPHDPANAEQGPKSVVSAHSAGSSVGASVGAVGVAVGGGSVGQLPHFTGQFNWKPASTLAFAALQSASAKEAQLKETMVSGP